MSLATLAALLKGEPGVWSIHPASNPKQPPDDPAATVHGKGDKPPIPSYDHRLIISVAVDTVRMYYLADSMPNAADKKILTDGAAVLYQNANCAAVPEKELLKLILGHWPLPAPSYWLLRIVNAVGDYQTALGMPPASGGALLAASRARIQALVDALQPGGDGGSANAGGGHT